MIQECSNWVTIIGLPFAVIAVFYTVLQLLYSKKIEEAKFWLQLRDAFVKYDKIHYVIFKNELNNPIGEQWFEIYGYLGQFELCNSMINNKLVNKKIFYSQYGYRLEKIITNQVIFQRILDEKQYWEEFISLCKQFDNLCEIKPILKDINFK